MNLDRLNNHLSLTSRVFLLLTMKAVLYSEGTAQIQISRFRSMSDGKQAPQNIQDAFLNTVRREKTSVTVYLLNGAKLTGRIRSFDKFSVLLETGSQEQLIFKHAISTISQSRRGSADIHTSSASEATRESRNDVTHSPEA